jgi:hypothetical protein
VSKKKNIIIQQAADLRQGNRPELVNLETFVKALNRTPAVTKKNKFANGRKYVPISHIQVLLDQMYFGLWQTKNFTNKVVGNELVGSIELWVYHPVIKDWMIRTGVAATQIRQHKGAALTDIDSKIKNALEMDAPHLYADCIKSAAKTLGPAFGRDLNRDFVDNYTALVSKHVESQGYSMEELKVQLDNIEGILELLEVWDSNPIWKTDPEVEALFNARKKQLL